MISRVVPLLVAAFVFACCGYAIQVFLARQLGPVDYGLVGLALSVVSLANVAQASGVPQAVSREVAGKRDGPEGVLSAGLKAQAALSAALLVVVVALAPVLGIAFRDPALVTYVLLMALMLPGFGALSAYGGFWNGSHRFPRQAGVTITYAISKAVLVIGLAWAYGPVGAVLGYVVAPLCGVVVGLRRVPWASGVSSRRLLQQARPMIGVALALLALYSVDLYLVRVFVLDEAATGHYVAAQSVAVIPLLATSAFAQVLLPRIAGHVGTDGHLAAGRALSQALRQVLLVLVPGVTVISATAPEVVRILFGAAYDDAGGALRVLVLSMGLVAVLLVLASGLNGAGQSRSAARCTLVGLAVTVVAGTALTPLWSLRGAALAVGIGALVGCVLALRQLRRAMPVSLGSARAVRLTVSGIVAYGIGMLPAPLALVPLQWATALSLAFGLAWVAGELTPEERARVRALVTRSGRAGSRQS